MTTPMTPEQAYEYFRKRVEQFPNETQSWGGFLASLHLLGRKDLVKQQIENFGSDNNEFLAEVLEFYGAHLMDTASRDDAEKIFKQVIKLAKDKHTAYGLLGELCVRQKRYKDAEKWLKESLKRSPRNIVVIVMLANVYILMKKYKDAELTARKALEIDPNAFQALKKLADALLGQEKHLDHIEVLRQMIKIKPDHHETLFTLGAALGLLGNLEQVQEGEIHIKRALELSPANKQYMGMLMIILNKLGKRDEAAEIKAMMEGRKGLSQ